MVQPPTYLARLNNIAGAELNNHRYFSAWADETPSDDVRAVLRKVAAREGDHAMAFAKRVDELGFALQEWNDPGFERQLEIASSTELSDQQKMEELGFAAYFERIDEGTDIFDEYFADHSLDIQTGELFGRFISEERDTIRLLRHCYQLLKTEKPTYLDTLNRIAVGESRAHQYFSAWIAVTTNADVKGVLQKVALREGEHGLAFAKRINELGFDVEETDDPRFAEQMTALSSTELSDLQKFDELGFGTLFAKMDRGESTGLFDKIFSDHSIDIATGTLLGRYVCEERDTIRLLKSCYDQLEQSAT